jgi:ABC-type multidrug transport system fused ATPase/permease subunit
MRGLIQNIRIIWGYLKNRKKRVFLTALLAVIFAFLEGIIPYIYGRIIDIVTINSASSLLFSLLGIWVLTSILSASFSRIVSLSGTFLGIDALSESVLEFSSHVIDLPLSFHRENKVGEIMSRISMAGEALRAIVGDTLFWIIPRFLTVLIGLSIMFFINWRLSLGAAIAFCLSIIIVILRAGSLIENQKNLNRKFERSAGILNDSFSNIQTIKSAGAGEFQKSIIKGVYSAELRPAFRKVSVIWENTDFMQGLLFSLVSIFIFGYAVFLMSIGKISNGVLVMFFGYLNLTSEPLRFILWQWLSVQRDMASIRKAKELLEIKPERYNEKGKVLKNIKGKIEYKDVSFGYKGRKKVIKDISFFVKPGQKVALVGGSGEGKTTIVDLLSLYFVPQKGKIFIDGIDIKNLKLDFLRSIIAYVPQDIILFNDTIKNNILYGKPDATKEEINKAARAAHIESFIDTLPKKYNTLVGERGVKLSAGQKQRLAIARAIIRDPKILILDEATSSLDVVSEKMVQEALDNLIKNKTTLIIAHRLSTIRKADKILVIEKGEIAESGTHDALMEKRGLYYNLYTLQFKTKPR